MKNNKTKRVISVILAAAVTISSLSPAFAFGYGNPYENYMQREFDNTFRKPLVNLGNFIKNTNADKELDKPQTYTGAVVKDVENGITTYGKNWLSDGLKAGCNKLTNPIINKIYNPGIREAIKGIKEEREILKTTTNPEIAKQAWNRLNLRWDTLKNLKDQKAAMKAGRTLPIDFVFAAWGIYDMMENPEIGYDSPFFEFCATEVKAYSNTIGLVPIIGKPLSLPFTLVDFVTSSKTVVKAVNDSKVRINCLDNATSWWNKFITKDSIFNPMGKFANWWYSGVGREGEQNARDMAQKVAVMKSTKMGADALGAMGVPFADIAIGATCTANGIGVYKPNIYLYPQEPTHIDVRFEYPELITVSDPVYNTGWSVKADVGGRLHTDGGEYDYLFYESRTEKAYYQYNAGYIIPENDRAAAFESILKGYGLNDKEIADFNEFWCNKLDSGCTYAMYPQLTETVDAAMPINVAPKPDSCIRLWFAFVKDDVPKTEARPEKFERTGYAMVEWGGFIVGKS